MTNKLEQTINDIKKNPHGAVARNAAHWLGTKVMSWVISEEGEYLDKGIHVSDISNRYLYCYSVDGDDEYTNIFNPFTDANHTRMLVREYAITTAEKLESPTEGPVAAIFFLVVSTMYPYGEDSTYDACQVLRKCYAEGLLKDENIQKWGVGS